MAKKKVIKQLEDRPISSKELKFWLRGILEFQSDDWIPNGEQWTSIKHKIFNLEDTSAPEVTPFRPLESKPLTKPQQAGPLRQEGDYDDGGQYEDFIGEPLERMAFPDGQPVGSGLLDTGGAPRTVAGNFPRIPPPTIVSNTNGLQGDPSNSKARNDLSGRQYDTDFK